MTIEHEAKTKFQINETHNAYKSDFAVLQETFRSLRRSVSANKSINEILTLSKHISNHLVHPQMPTNNDLSGNSLIKFHKTFEKLNEQKALFEEKGMSSSSKRGGEYGNPSR